MNDQRALVVTNNGGRSDNLEPEERGSATIRDIHALTPPRAARVPQRESWETGSHHSITSSENFTTMSREFSALVLAGSTVGGTDHDLGSNNLGRIREEENLHEETNPLAIVPDTNPLQSPRVSNNTVNGISAGDGLTLTTLNGGGGEVSVHRVKKEEVETKINAWQNAKIAKINNRFKREEAVLNGWEGEQVQMATTRMNKIERKLEEKRAKAYEKMQNEIAKAHRKAEERRASAEGKRGTKVAKILEIASLMKAVGRPPAKRSFF